MGGDRSISEVGIQQARPQPDGDIAAAGRTGDFERLVAVLDPDVVLRADFGGPTVQVTTGAMAVARLATLYGGKEPRVALEMASWIVYVTATRK